MTRDEARAELFSMPSNQPERAIATLPAVVTAVRRVVTDQQEALRRRLEAERTRGLTRLLLAADDRRAVGLLAQKLPDADRKDEDGWNRVMRLLDTLTPAEHLAHSPLDLLRRLFPEEDTRVFAPRPVSHHCPDDPEKIHAMLRGLGRAECDAILKDKGEIHVRDDICNRDYRFDAEALEAVFAAPDHRMH